MNRVQTLRSNVSGARPAGRLPGELYVNWADMQLGVIDAANAAVDLIPITFFSPLASYAIGDHVVEGDNIYRAIAAVAPGPFNPAQWVGNSIGDYLPLTGGALSGGLRIEGVIPTGQPGENLGLAIEGAGGFGAYMRLNASPGGGNGLAGYKAGNLRWAMDLGDFTAETGANAGSNFGLNAYADNGATLLSTPLSINRATGLMILSADPVAMLGVATKQYVDKIPLAYPIGDNRIINGNFAVNQRGRVSGTALAAAAYGHDRWKAGAVACPYTFAAALPDTTVTITAGTLTQIIEGGVIEGGAYTLSWTGTAQARVYQGAPTGAYAASPITTAALPAGVNTIIEFNAGTLTRVKFEAGTIATPFNRQSLAKITADCQRYYELSNVYSYGYQANSVDNSRHWSTQFSSQKRVLPTVVITMVPSGLGASVDSSFESGFNANVNLGNTTQAIQLASWTADAEL